MVHPFTMSRFGLTIIATLALTSAPSLGGELVLVSRAFDVFYEYTLTDELLMNAPKWDHGADNPPLAARKALRLAEMHAKRSIEMKADWTRRFHQLRLEQWEGRHFWRIVYRWKRQEANNTDDSSEHEFYVIVLMNGRIVPERASRDLDD